MNDVAPGAVGEIVWRGPTKSFGYLNEPERTAAAFSEDGWYRSGDLGTLDDENYLSVVGRVKDLVIRGGQNISPRELEDLIIALPEVADVAVIGIPDELFGERVCACLVLRPGAELSDVKLVAELRKHGVATFKLPERVEIFEDFPEKRRREGQQSRTESFGRQAAQRCSRRLTACLSSAAGSLATANPQAAAVFSRNRAA